METNIKFSINDITLRGANEITYHAQAIKTPKFRNEEICFSYPVSPLSQKRGVHTFHFPRFLHPSAAKSPAPDKAAPSPLLFSHIHLQTCSGRQGSSGMSFSIVAANYGPWLPHIQKPNYAHTSLHHLLHNHFHHSHRWQQSPTSFVLCSSGGKYENLTNATSN